MAENLPFDDLAVALEKIEKYGFQRVVLQIPDELLSQCVDIYNYFYENMTNENIDFFITADSTFGSSVDDISAEHVNSDVLIYFGTDLSGSCSIPMMIIPRRLPSLEIGTMTELILQYIQENNRDLDTSFKTLLIIDSSYHHQMDQIFESFFSHFPNLILGKKPPTSNLANWTPEISKQVIDPSYENLGGLLFTLNDLTEAPHVLYIGNKKEQLISILLRMSSSTVFSYTPQSSSDSSQISHHLGVNRREYRERYAGVLRVQESAIIGLIIGSMSLTGELTRVIVQQLTELIEASGRKCYCFVMGRLNEAKLCNFPEIDVFCLLSNDDNARVPAKTFHVPVVTPYELELGLGARDWECVYLTTLTGKGLYSASTTSAPDIDFQNKLDKVRSNQVRNSSSDSSEHEDDETDEGTGTLNSSLRSAQTIGDTATTVVSLKAESAVTVFQSAAADYLSNRDFKGLEPSIPQDMTTEIARGQFGIASSYSNTGQLEPAGKSEVTKTEAGSVVEEDHGGDKEVKESDS